MWAWAWAELRATLGVRSSLQGGSGLAGFRHRLVGGRGRWESMLGDLFVGRVEGRARRWAEGLVLLLRRQMLAGDGSTRRGARGCALAGRAVH